MWTWMTKEEGQPEQRQWGELARLGGGVQGRVEGLFACRGESTGGKRGEKASHRRHWSQEGFWHTDSRKSPEQDSDLIRDRVTDWSGLQTGTSWSYPVAPLEFPSLEGRVNSPHSPPQLPHCAPTKNTQGKGFNSLADCQQQPIESYQLHRHM